MAAARPIRSNSPPRPRRRPELPPDKTDPGWAEPGWAEPGWADPGRAGGRWLAVYDMASPARGETPKSAPALLTNPLSGRRSRLAGRDREARRSRRPGACPPATWRQGHARTSRRADPGIPTSTHPPQSATREPRRRRVPTPRPVIVGCASCRCTARTRPPSPPLARAGARHDPHPWRARAPPTARPDAIARNSTERRERTYKPTEAGRAVPHNPIASRCPRSAAPGRLPQVGSPRSAARGRRPRVGGATVRHHFTPLHRASIAFSFASTITASSLR
jgi:hypothetical protein